MSSAQTRDRLMTAAVALTSRAGVRAVTARAVAAEADVNQALVFYHFDGIDGLLREAFDRATREMVAAYVAELEQATSFADLHRVGVTLAGSSRADGSAALLSHVISAAHTDEAIAAVLAENLALWRTALSDAVRRVLAAHGLRDALDVGGLTDALAAASIGMITVDALPGQPLGSTLPSLGGLARLVDRAARLLPAALARRLLAPGP